MAKKPDTLDSLREGFLAQLKGVGGFSLEARACLYNFIKEANFRLDRRAVDPDLFFWLLPLYTMTRDELYGNPELDIPKRFARGLLFRKASQMGASSFAILCMLWLCIDPEREIGLANLWPNEKELVNFVKTRLDPMISSSEVMREMLDDSPTDNTQAKQVLGSTMYFRWVSGNSGLDSVPVDALFNDELRLWEQATAKLQRAKERYGMSKLRLTVNMSTVGSPGDLMEQEWATSNQFKYFTLCPSSDCHTEIGPDPTRWENRVYTAKALEEARGDSGLLDPNRLLVRGIVLSDFLPTQIARRSGRGEATWVCPCCGGVIEDRSHGGYVETRPEAEGPVGYEFARTLSPEMTAWELLDEYEKAQRPGGDMKQFMNGYMAKPYRDPAGALVNETHWARVRIPQIPALMWEPFGSGGRTFLGADFRTNEVHITIGEKGERGPGRILHLEQVQTQIGESWKPRMRQLLHDYNVELGVLDYGPQTNEVLSFAAEFEGLIYLSVYKTGGDKMLRLSQEGKNVRQVSRDARERYLAIVEPTLSMRYSLASFAQGWWRMPETPLLQYGYYDRLGNLHDEFDLTEGLEGNGREGFKGHLMSLSLVTLSRTQENAYGEKHEELGSEKVRFVETPGLDPHWAHSLNYMVMASLLDGQGMELLGRSSGNLETVAQTAQQGVWGGIPGHHPGLQGSNTPQEPPRLPLPPRGGLRTCGDCQFLPEGGSGPCGLLGWNVKASQPACNNPLKRLRIS